MRGVVSVNHNPSSAYLGQWAKAVLLTGDRIQARDWAARNGLPDQVVKAITSPMMTTDTDMEGLANTLSILTSFAPLLKDKSVLFRLLEPAGGMVHVPLRQRITWMTGVGTMGRVNESEVIKVSRLASDTTDLNPVRVSGMVIFSTEILRWLSEAGDAFLTQQLRRAIATAADAALFELIVDGSTPSLASFGGSAEAASMDIRYLFDEVELTAESRPLLVLAPNVARKAATLYEGNFVFPAMGPTGGSMCNVPAMVSDALADGEMLLIDGAGLAGDSLGIDLQQSREGLVQLDDNPDSPVTASTVPISLWQRNLIAVRPELYFGATRLRDNAVAKLTGVVWGSTDSPA